MDHLHGLPGEHFFTLGAYQVVGGEVFFSRIFDVVSRLSFDFGFIG